MHVRSSVLVPFGEKNSTKADVSETQTTHPWEIVDLNRFNNTFLKFLIFMKYDSSRIIFESESESQNLEKKFVGIHSWGKHIPSGLWASNKPPLFGVVWGQHADHRVRVISSWEIFGGTCPACHLLPQSSKNHPRCSMVAWYTYLHENHPKSTLYVSIGRYTNRPMEPIGYHLFLNHPP